MASSDDAAAAAASAGAAAASAQAASLNAAIAVSNSSVLSTLANGGVSTNRVFASTAAGLASTSNGNYFYVPSTSAQGAFDVWLNSSGTAQLITTLPNLAGIGALVVQPSLTFAGLPANPLGMFLVLADETKGGGPTIYLFTATHRYWIAMVQDA